MSFLKEGLFSTAFVLYQQIMPFSILPSIIVKGGVYPGDATSGMAFKREQIAWLKWRFGPYRQGFAMTFSLSPGNRVMRQNGGPC